MTHPDFAAPHLAFITALPPKPNVPLPSLLRGTHETRLARPQAAPLPGPVLPVPPLTAQSSSAQRAYEQLVSAACYLATRRTGDRIAAAQGSLLLTRLAGELAAERQGADSDCAGDLKQAELWTAQERRWERQSLIEGSVRFARVSSEARKVAIVPKRRSRWGRWLSAWQGTPGMQSF